MSKKNCYVLHDFPIVVDPLVLSLEVRLSVNQADEEEGRHVWKHLDRVRITSNSFQFVPSTSMIHFFGLAREAQACPFILVYDSSGVIRYRLDQVHKHEFEVLSIPAELNGDVKIDPSVRISFRNVSQANAYADLVNKWRDGSIRPNEVEVFCRLVGESVSSSLSYSARQPDARKVL